jgi:FlaA1/EpsC-like NDP-sugar epimerase
VDITVDKLAGRTELLQQRSTTNETGLAKLWKFRRRVAVITSQVLLSSITYVCSVLLITQMQPTAIALLQATLLLLLLVRSLGFIYFGLFKSSIRFASIPDLIRIGKSVSLTSLVLLVLAHTYRPWLPVTTAVLVLDWALLLIGLCMFHFGFGVYRAHRASRRTNTRRVLIVGAGESGGALLKELAFNSNSPGTPVALLDDDPTKVGTTVCGVPVVSGIEQLPKVVRDRLIDEVFICIPSASSLQMSRILAHCRKVDVPVKTLPSLRELLDGRVSLHDLRDVSIEDVLQRGVVPSDVEMIRSVVSGRVVLVTGAGGSIGSELCRQIAAAGAKKLVLAEKSENNLFYVDLNLREKNPEVVVVPVLVDVTKSRSVNRMFEEHTPEIVFHAAAHKHVRLVELWPTEAISNNILGTRNVAFAAAQFGCERFVNISTDKAVNPRCYMGLSKRITEICIQRLAEQSKTHFMNVRFGNVAGSSGSVLRLFSDRVKEGVPLRVTDTRATRYFMTIPEAVNLIIQAAGEGRGGETFIFDMGSPVNIYELARTVSLFSGLKPDQDIQIQIVGLGEGEKLEEELCETWEHPTPSNKPRILYIKEKHPVSVGIWGRVAAMEESLRSDDEETALHLFRSTIPEFERNYQKRAEVSAAPVERRLQFSEPAA